LEAAEHETTERAISRFLPNLETFRAIQELGVEAPAQATRLERTLESGLDRLQEDQNQDGGWGWWPASLNGPSTSDPFITSYALLGLARAREAGVVIDSKMFNQATDYLQATLVIPQMVTEGWQLDRLALQHYALAEAGEGDPAGALNLYEVRDQLNPWARAVLAMAIESMLPGEPRAQTLLADLLAGAERTATGAFWPVNDPGGQNMTSPVQNSAVVVYALARRDPASPVLADAARYLIAHRDASGGWASTYETAWVVMALTRFMSGTGELGGNFDYSASLNEILFAEGGAEPAPSLTPVRVTVPLQELRSQAPNTLEVQRGDGPGRLYYRAYFKVARPVETSPAISNGVSVGRTYYPGDGLCQEEGCDPVQSGETQDTISVRVRVTVQNDAHYLILEDYLPAGAEILDASLQTTQLGGVPGEPAPLYDPRAPFARGWGWWYFTAPQIYDERIVWSADFLPAGTYELTYTLVLLQPGEFRVLPARARQLYFPEVRGNTVGAVFEIVESP
jgi:uncharacterized protein YfaS (alpha-2-macroglobulin family)